MFRTSFIAAFALSTLVGCEFVYTGSHNGGSGFCSEIWDGTATEAGQLEIAVQVNDMAYTWARVSMTYDQGDYDLYGEHEVTIVDGWVEVTTPQALDEGDVEFRLDVCTADGACMDAFTQGDPKFVEVEVYKNFNPMDWDVRDSGDDPYLKAYLDRNL